MNTTLNMLLFWAAPAVAGALIGYVTNAIAIKMLFRPLNAVRIGGIRLPFTPGILPKQRHVLADNIGRMVEQELLTEELLRARLASPAVQAGVAGAVGAWTGRVAATPLGAYQAACAPATALVAAFCASPAFDALFTAGCTAFLQVLFPPADSAGAATEPAGNSASEENGGNTVKNLRDFLGDGPTDRLLDRLETGIEAYLRSGPVAVHLAPGADQAYPFIAQSCVRFLEKPETRQALEAQGRVFLGKVLDKLGPMQRLLISAGRYDATLMEKMPDIVTDLIAQLKGAILEPATRQKIVAVFAESVQGFLASDSAAPELSRLVRDFLSAYTDQPVSNFFPAGTEADVQTFAANLLSILRRACAGADMTALFDRFFNAYGDTPLETLLALTPERMARINAFLTSQFLHIGQEQIGAVLQVVNVRVLVRERIDSLDMRDVERIILDVLANQLKWINLFGAILGALIGLFQAGFVRFLQ